MQGQRAIERYNTIHETIKANKRVVAENKRRLAREAAEKAAREATEKAAKSSANETVKEKVVEKKEEKEEAATKAEKDVKVSPKRSGTPSSRIPRRTLASSPDFDKPSTSRGNFYNYKLYILLNMVIGSSTSSYKPCYNPGTSSSESRPSGSKPRSSSTVKVKSYSNLKCQKFPTERCEKYEASNQSNEHET